MQGAKVFFTVWDIPLLHDQTQTQLNTWSWVAVVAKFRDTFWAFLAKLQQSRLERRFFDAKWLKGRNDGYVLTQTKAK